MTASASGRTAIALYDDRLTDRLIDEYYGGSGFLNFGYWADGARDAAEAGAHLVERLLAMAPAPGPRVLDVACGGGATTGTIVRRLPDAAVAAVNISGTQLALCRRRLPRGRLARMDAARLGFADASFDTLVCVEAAFHFKTRADFLAEACRVLRPGGALVLSDALVSGRRQAERPDWDARNLVTDLDAYARLFVAAGFADVRVVDATEACWHRGFEHFARFAHARFLAGEIDLERLEQLLGRVYLLAEDLEHYVLVAAVKPERADARAVVSVSRPPRTAPAPPVFDVDTGFPDYQRGYDSVMYWPALREYYAGTDFVNYGFWTDETPDAGAAGAALVDRLLAFLPAPSGRVLDVACGKGATTRHLAGAWPAAQVVGVNVSLPQLASGRRNAPCSAFVAMDAAALGFADATFDTLVCVEAAFHFRTRERFFREAWRVLRPGGWLVLSDILLTRDAEGRRGGRHVENWLPGPREYAALARTVGFTDVAVVDATAECFEGAFWNLVRFCHERLLARAMTADALRRFRRHFFEFVPDVRHYVLGALHKPGPP